MLLALHNLLFINLWISSIHLQHLKIEIFVTFQVSVHWQTKTFLLPTACYLCERSTAQNAMVQIFISIYSPKFVNKKRQSAHNYSYNTCAHHLFVKMRWLHDNATLKCHTSVQMMIKYKAIAYWDLSAADLLLTISDADGFHHNQTIYLHNCHFH